MNWKSGYPLHIVLIAALAAGCDVLLDDSVERATFDYTPVFGRNVATGDLDFDGFDEVISRSKQTGDQEEWILYDSYGLVVDQITIQGRVLGPVSFAGFDEDASELEILMPVSRDDSLFLHVYDGKGQPAAPPIFIATGPKRLDPDGTTFPWEAQALFTVADLDADGENELFTAVATTYAGTGRGVYAHELTGEKRDSLLFGAALELDTAVVRDLDADGVDEVLFVTGTPNNGAEVNGFSDARAYIMSIELSLPLEHDVTPWESDVPGTAVDLAVGDFGSGPTIVIAEVERKSTTPGQSKMWSFGPGDDLGAVLAVPSLVPAISDMAAVDLDGDGFLELYVATREGRVRRMWAEGNGRERVVAERLTYVFGCPDVDGDDLQELCVKPANGETQVLGANLRRKAVIDRDLYPKTVRSSEFGHVLITTAGEIAVPVRTDGIDYLWRRFGALAIVLALSFGLLWSLSAVAGARADGNRDKLLGDTTAFITSEPPLLRDFHGGPSAVVGARELKMALDEGFRDRDFRVDSFATVLNRSERQLLRDCRRLTGLSSSDLLLRRRVHESIYLLLSAAAPSVDQIAETCGWTSSKRMRGAFKAYLMTTPTQFQDAHRGRGLIC